MKEQGRLAPGDQPPQGGVAGEEQRDHGHDAPTQEWTDPVPCLLVVDQAIGGQEVEREADDEDGYRQQPVDAAADQVDHQPNDDSSIDGQGVGECEREDKQAAPQTKP